MIHPMLISLHPDDRATYGGPEWLDSTASVDALDDLEYDILNALDEQVYLETGTGIIRCVGGQFSSWKLSATRVRFWLALWHVGVVIPLADFKPKHLLKIDVKPGKGDAVPPASTPGSSDTSTSETTPASATSGSASTRGSRARTSSSRRKPAA